MVVATKLQPLSRDLNIMIEETLSPTARSKAFADYARAELVEAKRINGNALGEVPPYRTWVDGTPEAPLETVDPDNGRILFEFEILLDVLVGVADMLYQKSPVLTGLYRSSHTLFADGIEVSPSSAPPAREYVFLNPLPYARKIEVGKMNMIVPGSAHVYEQVKQLASRRYSNVAKISFSYRAVSGSERVPALVIVPR